MDPVELGVWYLVAGLAVPAITWWCARVLARRRGRGGDGESPLAGLQSDLDGLTGQVDALAVQAAQRESYLAGRVRALIAVAEDSGQLRLTSSDGGKNGPGGNTAR